MKKLLAILSITLMCVGCNAQYSLEINKDLSVNETVVAVEPPEFYASYEKSSVGRVIAIILAPELDYLNSNNYLVNKASNSEGTGVIITNKFDNMEEYLSVSNAFLQYNSTPEYSVDGSIVTFHVSGHIVDDAQFPEIFNIDTASISITLPFVVTENNADKYDRKTHTYTWNVDKPLETKDILIKFNKDKLVVNYVPYIIAGALLIASIILGVIAYKLIQKSKKENEI